MKQKTKLLIAMDCLLLASIAAIIMNNVIVMVLLAPLLIINKIQRDLLKKKEAIPKYDDAILAHIKYNWDNKLKENWRIVAAAQRHRESGLIVAGSRHFDKVMRAQIFALTGISHKLAANWEDNQDEIFDTPNRDLSWNGSEGGFIDNYGDFLTREQAWIVADKAGQIGQGDHGKNGSGTLYSENIH